MICPFDMFGKGLHRYTFTNQCEESPTLPMGDGTTKIILNAASTKNDVDPKLQAFLDYVAGRTVEDDYIKKLDEAVNLAKANKEWRDEYMAIQMRDLENQRIGEIRGEKRGEKRGERRGERRGKKIGERRGSYMERRRTITNMLHKGRTPEYIAEECDYPLDLVLDIQKAIKSSE